MLSISKAQTAADVIGNYINVMGGKDKLLSIKNVYMEGSMDMNGTPTTIKYYIVNKKAVRYEYIVNGMSSYYIFTNDSGWMFSPMMGQKQAQSLSASVVRSMQPELDPEGLLINYASNGYKIELKGKDDVAGKRAYRIFEKLTDSLSNTYYIDTATFYILRISTSTIADGKPIEMSRDFGDYRKNVDGYTFPMSMGVGMIMGGQVKFSAVKVNSDIDPDLFKPKR